MKGLIGIAIAVAVLFGGPIVAWLQWAYASLKARTQTLPSLSGIFSATVTIPIWKALALVVAFWLISGGVTLPIPSLPTNWNLPSWLPSFISKADAAVYVYEKDASSVPNEVAAAIDKLNRERKITASQYEHDTKNGIGGVPEQYKAAVVAAEAAGLPALVASAGSKVLKVTKDPRTIADVIGGVP